MRPIRTPAMATTYSGPSSDIGDLPCERMQTGQIRSVWEPSPEERALIAAGGNVEVTLFCEPIPPLAVTATDESAS